MPRAPSLEASLARLNELRSTSLESEEERGELLRILEGRHGHASGVAAEIIAERRLEGFETAMVAVFHRLMENPVKRDPGCHGKAQIAEALHQLDAYEREVFAAGAVHVQPEPVWGGTQDTATDLRSAAARGLVRVRDPNVLSTLADHLADPELPVRISAAQSVAYHGTEAGLPMLRLKVHHGDPEPEVIGECLLAMMRIAPSSSVDFVAGFLEGDDPVLVEGAALALGESRAEEAFESLTTWWPSAKRAGLAEPALNAIALLRSERAIDFLVRRVAEERGPEARAAIAALALYQNDERVRERTAAAANENSAPLGEALREAFGDEL